MLRLVMAALIVTAMAHGQLHAAPKTTCTTQTGNFSVKQGDKTLNCTSKETCTTVDDTKISCRDIGGQLRCGPTTTTTITYDGCSAAQTGPGGAGGIVPDTRPGVLAPDTSSPPTRGPQIFRPGGTLQRFQQQ